MSGERSGGHTGVRDDRIFNVLAVKYASQLGAKKQDQARHVSPR